MTSKQVDENAVTELDPAKGSTKAQAVLKLLSRARGATMEDMAEATNWQPHSIRAFLSGLRKKSKNLIKEERKNGATSYRMGKAQAR